MNCEPVTLTIDSLDDRDISKAMLKYWLYQAEQARQRYSAAASRLESAQRANAEVQSAWEAEDTLDFRGPMLPFSKQELDRMTAALPEVKKNWEESTAMAGYFVNFLTDKAHPLTETEVKKERDQLRELVTFLESELRRERGFV